MGNENERKRVFTYIKEHTEELIECDALLLLAMSMIRNEANSKYRANSKRFTCEVYYECNLCAH